MPKGQPDKGYALTPQREKVLRILATEGPLDDEAGLVVSRLRERTGHENTQSLSMVIKALETSGLIKRDVAGRRTYHLELVPDALAPEDRERLGLRANGEKGHHEPVASAPSPDQPEPVVRLVADPIEASIEEASDETAAESRTSDSGDSGDGIDYRRLADELLKAALTATARKGGADPKLKIENAELKERLAEERYRLDDLAAQLLQRGNELLEAKAMIRTLEHNLKVIGTQQERQTRERGSDPIEKRLTPRERKELADLKQLMESRPGTN